MNNHKHRRVWLRHRKLVLIVAAGLLLVAAAGTTLAWLTAQSATLSNAFDSAAIGCETDETFSNGVKSNVSIRNTGTMDAYIRAALVPVWKDGDSIAAKAASITDCTIKWGNACGTQWKRSADGFFYCTVPIPPDENTPILIDSCLVDTVSGYHFELQISAQAIQALPASAVTDAWGSGVSGVQADGTLEVKG